VSAAPGPLPCTRPRRRYTLSMSDLVSPPSATAILLERSRGVLRSATLLGTGGLALAQLFHLGQLMHASPLRAPAQDLLGASYELHQGWFHLMGTALLGAYQLLLGAPGWPRGKARVLLGCAEPCLAVLLLSCVTWVLWAGAHVEIFALGVAGALLGLGLPPISAALLLPFARHEERGSRVHLLIVLCAMTWLWSLLFAMTQMVRYGTN
jgi:hypothetical protein